MNKSNHPVYDTLFDWQKRFVDKTPREYFQELTGRTILEETDSDSEKIGFFLRMGIGKTKISVAKAEMKNADCVFVTSLKSKVEAGELPGEFGDELKQSGYEVFYAHKALDNEGNMTILSLDIKKQNKLFIEAVSAQKRIAYIFNHEHITTKKGYQRLVYLASQYKNVVWIVDEAHKISNKSAAVSKRIHEMLYKKVTPLIKINIRDTKRDLKLAKEALDFDTVNELENQLNLVKTNVFKDNVKGFYLLTGTPNAGGYVSFYWLLELLGYQWKFEGLVQEEDIFGNRSGPFEKVSLTGYKAFFEEYCVEDLGARRFNPYGRAIKSYKNVEQLFDLIQQFAFFAKTENYYPGLPSRLSSIIWVKQDKTYKQMTDESKKNPHYRVLDGYICDTPALLSLRSRQLASGFMGNAEHSDYYHTNKVEVLQEYLENNERGHIIFYNYTPELYMIISAAEDAGYAIDVYNGIEKSQANYRKANADGSSKNVLIANIDSGSAALNLQKYHSVIFYSLPDTFKDYDQAIGRVERIGQQSLEVDVVHLITSKTIEEKIYDTLMKGEDYTQKMYERDFIWRID